MIFNVTDYLKLHNAISIYHISHIFTKNVNLILGHYKTLTTCTLGKKIKSIKKKI